MAGFEAAFDEHMASSRYPAGMTGQKREAFARFMRSTLPTKRGERWRYTDAAAILQESYQAAPTFTKSSIQRLLFAQVGERKHQLVFVAGRFAPEFSSKGEELAAAGVTIGLTAEPGPSTPGENPVKGGVDAETMFEDLRYAFFGDGATIRIAEGVKLREPLHLLHLNPECTQSSFAPFQILIEIGRGAEVTLIETTLTDRAAHLFVSGTLNIDLKEDALLTAYMVRSAAGSATFVSETSLKIAHRAKASLHVVSAGGKVCRQGIRARLLGPEARFTIDALGLLTGGAQLDYQIDVHHLAPYTTSRQLFKQIVADRSKAAFEGHIHVAAQAKKTDAYQLNRTMLLDATAQFAVKPQLYIDNADVKCSHGAATGRVREEELFYLQSRGISPQVAKQMLCRAFAAEITGKIKHETIRLEVAHMIDGVLNL